MNGDPTGALGDAIDAAIASRPPLAGTVGVARRELRARLRDAVVAASAQIRWDAGTVAAAADAAEGTGEK
jgi:hypothetical protein